MKKVYLFLLMMIVAINLFSQLQDRIWIFGRPVSGSTNATLYFGNINNPVVNLPNGQPNNITVNNGWEQWAIVTHPTTGHLIFYTDGQSVFDSLNNLVSGINLGGNFSSMQPAAIAPAPQLKGYYIFSNPTGASPTSVDIGPVTYRVYNYYNQTFGPLTNLPGNYGTTDVSEGMKIIPCDSSSNVLWLVVSLFPHPGLEKKYVVYKIDQSIVTYNGIFDFGPQKQTVSNNASPAMDITYTKANMIYGITNVGFSLQNSSAIFNCQFDNIHGQFLTSTTKIYNAGYTTFPPTIYNLEFSPNGRFLYYSVYGTQGNTNGLFQIDLQDSILTSTLIHTFSYYNAGGLKLGPDGYIYHIYDSGYNSNTIRLGRILQPDIKYIPGTTVYSQFYQENFKTYNNMLGIGLCEFLVLPTNSNEVSKIPDTNVSIYIYPNPASENIHINITTFDKNLTLNIYNIVGKLVKSEILKQNNQQIDINDLDNGVYVISVNSNDFTVTQKLIIQR